MSWTDCTLGDVMTLKRGHDLPARKRLEGRVPVVSSSGVTGFHNESKADAPGVVTGRYGTLGEVYFIKQAFWPHNTALYVTDFKDNNPRFVAYFLKNAIRNYRTDKAAVPGVDRNVLHRLKVRVPDHSIQERISHILSAYDDLIENNLRRITLLEQAARELYREWFVRLRFPGHEHTKIVDGVPEGWKKVSFAELADFVNGYAFKPAHLGEAGLPIVKIPELRNGITAKTPRNPGDLIPSKYHIQDGDLLYSWSGTLAVNVWTSGDALLNQHLFLVIPTGRVSRAFLMFALRESQASFENQTVGATMKHIRRSALNAVSIVIPDSRALKDFEQTLAGVWNQVINLYKQNNELAAARDLLQPRLINGMIAV